MASGKQACLIAGAVGCGVVALALGLAVVTGGLAVRRLVHEVREVEAAHEAVTTEHGRVEDYRPPADGKLEPERIEVFLEARARLADARRDLLADLARLSAAAEEGARGSPGGIVATLGSALGLLPGVLADGQHRSEILLAVGMGHGEYLYLYALAYDSWLGHSPGDGPAFRLVGDDGDGRGDPFEVRERRLELIRRRLNERLLPMLRHQLADARVMVRPEAAWLTALEEEISALEADPLRLPWQDGLPAATAASLEPFRSRLEASYTPLCNPLDTAVGP